MSKHLEQKTKIRGTTDEIQLYWTSKENCKADLIDSGVLSSLNLTSVGTSKEQPLKHFFYSKKKMSLNDKLENEGSLSLKGLTVSSFTEISPPYKPKSLYTSSIVLNYSKMDGFAFRETEIPLVLETVSNGSGLSIVGCTSSLKTQYSIGDIAQMCQGMGADYYFDGSQCQNRRVIQLENQITNLQNSIEQVRQIASTSSSSSTVNAADSKTDKLDSPACFAQQCIVSVRFVNKKPGAKVVANSTKCLPAGATCTNNTPIGTIAADGTFSQTGHWNCNTYEGPSGADQSWYVDGQLIGSHSWRCDRGSKY